MLQPVTIGGLDAVQVANATDRTAPRRVLSLESVTIAGLRTRIQQLATDAADIESSGLGEWDEGYRDAVSDVLGLLDEVIA